jgi:hypothetical protein
MAALDPVIATCPLCGADVEVPIVASEPEVVDGQALVRLRIGSVDHECGPNDGGERQPRAA